MTATLDVRLIGAGAGLPDKNLIDRDRHYIMRDTVIVPDENGVITLPMRFKGVNADEALKGYQEIAEILTAAERLINTPDSNWVTLFAQVYTSRAASWIIKGGSMPPVSHFVGMEHFVATLRLFTVDPFSYGERSTTTTSLTLTNGAASMLMRSVVGDEPSPVRITLTRQGGTAIPGYRIGIRPIPAGLEVADWTSLIDLVEAGGTDTADAGSVGAFYVAETLADHAAWVPIAGASQGADVLAPGKYHAFLRMADVPTTPTVSAPTALAGTVTDRAVISDADVTSTVWTAAVVRQTVGHSVTGITDATATQAVVGTWSLNTLADSDWFAFVTASRGTGGLVMTNPTPPAGWTLIDSSATEATPDDPELWMWVYAQTNAGTTPTATTQTWTLNHTTGDTGTGVWRAAVVMVEVTGAGANPVDVFSIHPEAAAPLSEPVFSLARSTRFPAELVLTAFASVSDNAAQYAYWQGGFDELAEAAPLGVASLTAGADETGTFPAAAVNRVVSAFTAASLSIVGTSVTTVTSTETLDGNIPGNLQAGSVDAVVQAQDVYGNLSAPTSVATDTVVREGGRIDYTWSGSAAAFVFSWGLNGQFRQATVYGNAFTLTDMTQGAAILALPTTSSITTRPSRYRLRVGTPEAQYGGSYTFETPHGSTMATVYAGTWDFPPTPALTDDGERPEWGLVVEGSGIGEGRVDALWLFSAEPGASFATIRALDDIANVFVYELRPDGVVACWIESVDGTEQYPARAVGNLYLPPGDSILTIEALGTGDTQGLAFQSSLSRQFIAAVSYLPRYRWLAGGG